MNNTARSVPPRPTNDHHRWAWRLGSLAGIPIYIHATFVLLLAWVAFSHFGARHEVALAVQGLILVVSVFAVVVAHELGHALVVRRFGIPTHDITLYPIGGISRLERMPERPGREFLVAIAGPAVNFVLAFAIFAGLWLAGVGAGGNPLTIGGAFAVQLMWINISLGAFNLLPAFPMDGGRILRAALAWRMPRERATIVASHVARGLAVAMGLAGLLWSPLLAVISLFVWIAAGQEARAALLKASLHGLSVESVMVTHVETLAPSAPLGVVARSLFAGFQHDFPVVRDGRVVGMLTHDDAVGGLAMRRPELTVADVMHHHFAVADAHDGIATMLARTPPDSGPIIVVDHGHLVGLVDPEQLGRSLASRAATLPRA